MFGELVVQCDGYEPVVRTMRFGDNSMDKLNLPVPGADGPDSYDDSILFFDRQGTDELGRVKFRARLGDEEDLQKRKSAALSAGGYAMRSGRRYGLLY